MSRKNLSLACFSNEILFHDLINVDPINPWRRLKLNRVKWPPLEVTFQNHSDSLVFLIVFIFQLRQKQPIIHFCGFVVFILSANLSSQRSSSCYCPRGPWTFLHRLFFSHGFLSSVNIRRGPNESFFTNQYSLFMNETFRNGRKKNDVPWAAARILIKLLVLPIQKLFSRFFIFLDIILEWFFFSFNSCYSFFRMLFTLKYPNSWKIFLVSNSDWFHVKKKNNNNWSLRLANVNIR